MNSETNIYIYVYINKHACIHTYIHGNDFRGYALHYSIIGLANG